VCDSRCVCIRSLMKQKINPCIKSKEPFAQARVCVCVSPAHRQGAASLCQPAAHGHVHPILAEQNRQLMLFSTKPAANALFNQAQGIHCDFGMRRCICVPWRPAVSLQKEEVMWHFTRIMNDLFISDNHLLSSMTRP
jgi:hypothetical protein